MKAILFNPQVGTLLIFASEIGCLSVLGIQIILVRIWTEICTKERTRLQNATTTTKFSSKFEKKVEFR